MGVKFNREGIVLQAATGQLIQDSMMSAHSGKRVVPGGVLEKVPGTDGLFVRLLPREARQLSRAERANVYEKAQAWRAAQVGQDEVEPEVPGDSGHAADPDGATIEQPVVLGALTLSQLQTLAREVGLKNYSKLSKADLTDVLRDAVDGDGQPLVITVDDAEAAE